MINGFEETTKENYGKENEFNGIYADILQPILRPVRVNFNSQTK